MKILPRVMRRNVARRCAHGCQWSPFGQLNAKTSQPMRSYPYVGHFAIVLLTYVVICDNHVRATRTSMAKCMHTAVFMNN